MSKSTDLLETGEELEPLDFHVTREFNENYLHAIEDLHPRYQDADAGRAPLAHTALLVNYSNLTRSPSFRLPEGVSAIHTHEEIDLVGLARVGETFRVAWRVVDTYERRGRRYQVMEALVAAQGGRPILRRLSVNTFTGGPYRGVETPNPPPPSSEQAKPQQADAETPNPPLRHSREKPAAYTVTRRESIPGGAHRPDPGSSPLPRSAESGTEVRPGHEAAGPSKYVTSYRTWLFSGGWPRFEGWPARNVHTDLEVARACALPARGASGAMLIGYLAEMMVDLFGEEWLAAGRLDLKFLRLVEVDDRVAARGVVASTHAAAEVNLWCENQRGEQVCTGTGHHRPSCLTEL